LLAKIASCLRDRVPHSTLTRGVLRCAQEEKLHNPFMRVAEASLQKACGTANMVDTMGEVRRRKDAF
jgi:hypothetical protein